MKPVRQFIKINLEDIEYAEEYFEGNDKQLSEFLLNVIRYYRQKEIKIKSKNVQKYFNNYKKTMNLVIESKKNGYEGYLKRIENEEIKNQGVNTPHDTQHGTPLPVNINNKGNINNKRKDNTVSVDTVAFPDPDFKSSDGKYGDDELYNECLKYQKNNPDKYPNDMYKDFLEYWTSIIQTGKGKGKELWREQKTWRLSARLKNCHELIWKPKQVANPKGNVQKFIIY